MNLLFKGVFKIFEIKDRLNNQLSAGRSASSGKRWK